MFTIVSIAGFVASITSVIGLLPQVYKTYKTKSAKDISMLMLINYLICSLAWVVYGFYSEAYFVLYSNIIGTAVSIISIIQKKNYDS
jgi:MtN3 and saliva related transmembrane protein